MAELKKRPEPGDSQGLTMLQGVVLDMTAEGRSPRDIAAVVGCTPAEAARMAYDLLDSEIITDVEQRRKLQVYRMEKMVQALWARTMENAGADDMKNLREILKDMNELLALNKEQDSELAMKMHAHQFGAYMAALMGLVKAFQLIAPDAMSQDEWASWTADQLEVARDTLYTDPKEITG